MSGNTAAPSGTSASPVSSSSSRCCAMSTSGDGGDDAQLVTLLHWRAEIVKIADVLVIEIDVDEAPKLAILEDPLRHRRELPAQSFEHCLHRASGNLNGRQAVGMLAQGRRYLNTYGHGYS